MGQHAVLVSFVSNRLFSELNLLITLVGRCLNTLYPKTGVSGLLKSIITYALPPECLRRLSQPVQTA